MKSLLLSVALLLAQKPVEKPKVHTDFYFGTYPTSRQAEELVKDEVARTVLVAFHEGWSIDKIAKTLKLTASDIAKMSDKLEDEGLTRRGDYDSKPAMVVIRERDYDRLKDSLRKHTQEFTRLVQDNWADIEKMVDSLEGAKGIPKDRVMYETAVSGILLGGMIDAFFEDKTFMPGPPRRGKSNRFFAWLAESNPALAGTLKRELRESAGYRVVTIGSALSEEKLNPDDLRGKATILEEADARKYRTFISVLTRDKFLPYFKNRREEFLKLGALTSSGSYVAFAEFFAWYYNQVANGVTSALVASKRIAPPEKLYTYAVKAPQ